MKTLKRLVGNPLSVTGLVLILFFMAVAIAAPWLAPPERPHDPYKIPQKDPQWKQESYWSDPLPPNEKHLFGTTKRQYDIFYGVVWGTRTAFKIGLIVTLSIAFIGIVLGAVSGYFGRWIDELLMRVTEIFLAFPFLVAAIVLTAILGKGLDKIMIALIAFGWPTYARLVRGDVLAVKASYYVEASRALGASDWRILFKHVLPNAIYPVFVLASLDMGAMVLSAAGLSFLGLGSEPGYADWGQMISFARDFITDLDTYWYTVIFPGGAILLFVLGWNLLGDAFRDILDPRMRGTRA